MLNLTQTRLKVNTYIFIKNVIIFLLNFNNIRLKSTMFNKVTPKIIEILRKIAGPENCLTEPEKIEDYSHDETPLYKTMPEIVVKVSRTREISEIMKLANNELIPVTPRAGGTGLSGGAIPVFGGIIISFERMNKIKEVDEENLMVVVEPGVITGDLGKELEKYNLFFPPDPISLDSCCIGGNIAECAGGPKAVKYGVVRNYISGLEVVLPNGHTTRLSGKLLKNVVGYSLMDLIVGSEGTLAVITEATLKLLPLPRARVDLLIPFKKVEEASVFAAQVVRAGILPSTMELMDGEVVRNVEKFLGRPVPFSNAGVHLIVQLDGDNIEEIRKSYEKVGEIALNSEALDVLVAEDRPNQEKIWEPRKKTGEILKALGKKIVAREDLVVPRNKIPDLINQLKAIEDTYKIKLFAFGHMGDGNIHTDMLAQDGFDQGNLRRLSEHVYQITLSLGGTITAEHGIGLIKKSYLHLALDPVQIEIMKSLKKAFDPNNILNPGKIFPDTD